MKRTGSFLVILLFALLLSACGSPASTAAAPVQAAPAQTAPQQAAPADPVPAVPYEQQRTILENMRPVWDGNNEYYGEWYYTFADLDRNGRLEVITAATQGTGIFTTALVWELSEDLSRPVPCEILSPYSDGPAPWPELIVDSIACYTDPAGGQCWYVCEDLTRDGAARYFNSQTAFCLSSGRVSFRFLASKTTEYTNGGQDVTIVCEDEAGQPISEQDYDNAAARSFAGWQNSVLRLEWTRVEMPLPGERETAPAATPVPAPAQPTGPAVTITKNPTSEALTIGGKTWFIAHADNAVSLTWQMMRPDGSVCSLDAAMAENPGLSLEPLEGDTIAVSNVPLSANGWGVRALFEGPGGSAATEPAYLYVGDYLTAYASVIDNYRRLFANGAPDLGASLEMGLGDALSGSEHVGYAFKDLDKDGIPELIIAGIDRSEFVEKMIYGVFTLENGAPRSLVISNARDRWYLRTDSSLVNEGSSGAGYSSVSLYRLQNGSLVGTESVFTYYPGNASDGCYYRQGEYSYGPRESDRRISTDQYQQYWNSWSGSTYIPPLTKIA